ncbi:MAG: rRNA maturation RNase YbeY [Gammaproteobacteria bacterium]
MVKDINITVQKATRVKALPTKTQFTCWVNAALQGRRDSAELTIRIVDEDESATLNRTYRHKDYPTNVLSFPASAPPGIKSSLLGDLVICAPVVLREAAQQRKATEAHWAHLTVHGILHLLGYDHEAEARAREMESLETAVLAGLGYSDPYA